MYEFTASRINTIKSLRITSGPGVLPDEIQKYFSGLGMHERTFREGTMISGQEEWFDIHPYPNDDERLNIRIKEIELQPYYVMYFDNEEENVEQAVKRFIFPGQAWVYEKKKEA